MAVTSGFVTIGVYGFDSESFFQALLDTYEHIWLNFLARALRQRRYAMHSASRLPVALFLPRIGAIVVAALLPEAGTVAFHEFQAVEPLGAFIGIELGNDQAYRATVIRLQILTIVLERDQYIVVVEIFQWNIGRVARPGMHHDKIRFWQRLCALQYLANVYPFPGIVVAAPGGHTMEVGS